MTFFSIMFTFNIDFSLDIIKSLSESADLFLSFFFFLCCLAIPSPWLSLSAQSSVPRQFIFFRKHSCPV